MAEIVLCTNPDCKRPFSVIELAAGAPGAIESEDVRCPHCPQGGGKASQLRDIPNKPFNARTRNELCQ